MRMTGIEPAHRTILEPKSSASASSATSACIYQYIILSYPRQTLFYKHFTKE